MKRRFFKRLGSKVRKEQESVRCQISEMHPGNSTLLPLVLEQPFSKITSVSDTFRLSPTGFGSVAGGFQTLFWLTCLLVRATLVKPEIIFLLELQRAWPIFIKLTCTNHDQIQCTVLINMFEKPNALTSEHLNFVCAAGIQNLVFFITEKPEGGEG